MAEGHTPAVASRGLTIQALDGHLRRFETVPDLLLNQERVERLVQDPTDVALVQEINVWLEARNAALESSDIYIMTPDQAALCSVARSRV